MIEYPSDTLTNNVATGVLTPQKKTTDIGFSPRNEAEVKLMSFNYKNNYDFER